MAEDEPVAPDETDGTLPEPEGWPQLSPLELGVCLADGGHRTPEPTVERATEAP